MTLIDDHLTYADGRAVNGQVVVSWLPFQIAGMPVAGGMEIFPIIAGLVNISLYANTTAQPTGSYYTAVYQLEEGALYTEYWIVPDANQVTLGQVRVLFPPAPSVLISAQQLTSSGAQFGQFLGWNGVHWVPMSVTMTNVTPNTIGMVLTSNVGPDLAVTGSPAPLGQTLALNVPDAGPSSRGVVNTGAQTFAGQKTFSNGIVAVGVSIIAGYVPTTTQVNTGYGLTGGGPLTGNLALAAVDDTTQQRIQVLMNLMPGGIRSRLNFIPGTNIGLTIADNQALNQVDITIAAPAILGDPTTTIGDLIVRGPLGLSRLAVSTTDGQILIADSTLSLGVRWGAPQVVAGPGLTGGGILTGDVTLTASVVTVFGRTGNVVLTAADITGAGGVISTVQVIAGVGLTGGGPLSANVTISGVVFGASGVSHAIGMVPDPGATLGGTRYLREDATWAIPSGTGGGMTDPTIALGDLIVRGGAAPTRLGVGTNGQVLTTNSAAPLGVNWATPAPAGITSVFGRTTPAIVAQAGDYTVAQVTGAVPNTVAVLAGLGMSGGGPLTGNVTLNANVTSVFGRTGGINAAAGDYTAAMVTNAVDATRVYSNPPWLTSIVWGIISGAPAFFIDPTSAKGDLIVHGTITTRLGVGTDGQVLTADSTQALGVRWGQGGAGAGGTFTPYSLIGLQNGTNTVFTVTAIPTSFQLFRNGMLQVSPGDYTSTSSGGITTVTFALAPVAADLLAFWGQSGVSGIPGVFSPRTISGTQNGTNTVFDVSAALTAFQLFRNGILQVSPGDYTYTSSGGHIVITFMLAPDSTDLLAVWGE